MASSKRKRWSQRVTQTSNALDLEQGVFSKDDPRSIARSLKRSADRSKRRKRDPFRAAYCDPPNALKIAQCCADHPQRKLPAPNQERCSFALLAETSVFVYSKPSETIFISRPLC